MILIILTTVKEKNTCSADKEQNDNDDHYDDGVAAIDGDINDNDIDFQGADAADIAVVDDGDVVAGDADDDTCDENNTTI